MRGRNRVPDDYHRLSLEEGIRAGTPLHLDGTRPPSPRHRIRRRRLFIAGLLVFISLGSSFIFLFNVGPPHLAVEELPLEEGLFRRGWRYINSTSPALAPIDPPERPTLTQAFFSPECADAWVARGTLCSAITHGTLAQGMRDSLKLSVLYTWVNGSDERLRAWKEALAKNQEVNVQYGRKIPGYAARHFRYDPLLLSFTTREKY